MCQKNSKKKCGPPFNPHHSPYPAQPVTEKPVDLIRKQIVGTKSRWLETGQSSSIPDMVRGLSHRTSFLNPSSTILHRIPTTPPGRAQLLRLVRPFPSMFGYAAAPLDGSEQYNSGGESRGVGGMSPLGSRHLDTRSSRGTGYTRSNV